MLTLCKVLQPAILPTDYSNPLQTYSLAKACHLHESSGVLTSGAISDSISAVPEGFNMYSLAREAPCTEDQPRMASMSLPWYRLPLRTERSLS